MSKETRPAFIGAHQSPNHFNLFVMKIFLKNSLLATCVLFASWAFVQSSATTHEKTRHVNIAKKFPTTEQGLVLVSDTASGTISLIGKDLPLLILGKPGEGPESEINSLGCHCFGHVSDSPDCYATGGLGSQYNSNCNFNTQTHKADCCGRVKNALAALSPAQKQSIATCLCASNKAAGPIFAYYGIGTKPYEQCDNKIGTLNRPLPTTTCTCPKGWASDTNVDGGITKDGKCKKVACQPMGISPFPPDGTAVGAWGFTWGNALIAWGTTANGGAAICVTNPALPCTFTWQ